MCDYAHMTGRPFLTYSQVKKIATEAKRSGIKLIRFTGGEPLLDLKTPDYIAYLHQSGFKTSLITNGFLLPQRAVALAKAGLDQVIVSLDGSKSELHDKLRGLPGLFSNALSGIKAIKLANENIIIRVNTVVSPHNIGDLEKMLDLLSKHNVDQWSLIPLKETKIFWDQRKLESYLSTYRSFQKAVKDLSKPKLLGYSKQWAGRDRKETEKYFTQNIPYTPRKKCSLAKRVRFYDPQTDKLSACNCVPWRIRDVKFNTDISLKGLNDGGMEPLVDYLCNNGPGICNGCEPINAYLGEHPDILEDDLFLF
jgi:cytosylglucuronate decarboxylase